jgi:LPS O-antigen subunit length determinant protein (WzzB/FepE family)
MTRDEAFAQGFRLAWRNIWLIALTFVLAFAAMSAIGYFAEQIEIADAIQRAAQ